KAEGTDEDFLVHELRKRIIEASDRNTDKNDERAALLYWSRVTLLAVLWLTTLAAVPYVANQVRFSMPTPATPSQPAPQPAPQNTTPTPPSFPPNREIREGDIPRKK